MSSDMRRPGFWFGVCVGVSLLFAAGPPLSARAADVSDTVTIHLDAARGSALESATAADHSAPDNLATWERWAGAGPATGAPTNRAFQPLNTTLNADSVDVAAAANFDSLAAIEVVNRRATRITIRIGVRLPAGLWRTDAALIAGAIAPALAPTDPPIPAAPVLWRMEPMLRATTGWAVKTVDLPAAGALILRWSETAAAAREARKAVRRACWSTADHPLQDRVAEALTPVDDILDALPALIGRGDRSKITRRIHTALLATAKAQALWENGRGDSLDDRDAPFADLLTALSEVACAGFDLVPASGDTPAHLLVSLTNSGARTVPLVALGAEHTTGGHQGSDLSVFSALAPGSTVSRSFPIVGDSSDVRGIVQFVSDFGAATVPAAPEGPAPDTVTAPE